MKAYRTCDVKLIFGDTNWTSHLNRHMKIVVKEFLISLVNLLLVELIMGSFINSILAIRLLGV